MGEAKRRKLAGEYPVFERAEYHDFARMILDTVELRLATGREVGVEMSLFSDAWNTANVYDFGGCFNSKMPDFLGYECLKAIRETAFDLSLPSNNPESLTVYCFSISANYENGITLPQPFGRIFVIIDGGVIEAVFNHDGRIWHSITDIPPGSYLKQIIAEATLALTVWHEDFVTTEPTRRASQDAALREQEGEKPMPAVMRVRTIHLTRHRVISHLETLRQTHSKREVGSHERTLCNRVIHSRSKLGKPFSYTLKNAGQRVIVNADAKPAVPTITMVAP